MGVVEPLSLLEQKSFTTPAIANKMLDAVKKVVPDAQVVDLLSDGNLPTLADGRVPARPPVLYFKTQETDLSLFVIVGSVRYRKPVFGGGFGVAVIEEDPEVLDLRFTKHNELDEEALGDAAAVPDELAVYLSPFDPTDGELYWTKVGKSLGGSLELV